MKKQYYPLLSYLAIAVFLFGTPLCTSAQKYFTKAKSSLSCQDAPIIHCPPNYTACPGSSTDPIVSLSATAEPGSIECAPPIVAFTDNIIKTGNCPGSKLIQRIWTATDPGDPSLRSFCIQYLSTLDTLPPVFLNCPRDTSILSNSKCMSQFSWIMPWVTDVCGNFTVTTSHPNGDDFAIGHHRIIITAIDVCGNSSTCSFNLEVISNCCTAPKITCPPDFISCPGSSLEPSVTGRATGEKSSPNCKNPLVTFIDRTIHSSACSTEIERTWIAIDPDNTTLFTTCKQKIKQQDLTPPVFIFCPSNITVQSDGDCTATVTWQNAIAIDNCGPVTIASTVPSGWKFTVGVSAVAIVATDACGNTAKCEFLVLVEENCCKNAPIINCPADFISCPGTSLEPSVTGRATGEKSSPNCKNPIVAFIDRTVHSSACSTEIERTWIAVDPDNTTLFSTCKQKIKLQDLTPPVFLFCPSNITVQSEGDCTATVTWQNAIAIDNCGPVTIVSSVPSGWKFTVGVSAVAIVATDACGNTAKCEFLVIVEENCCKNAPIINCPADFISCPGTSLEPSVTGRATGEKSSPNCKNPLVAFIDRTVHSSACNIEIERTWIAIDPDNTTLFSTCKQKIKQQDLTPPVFIFCPSNITVQSDDDCTAIVTWQNAFAIDNCGPVTIVSSVPSGWKFTVGVSAVAIVATDACGNTAKCEFLVIVEENCCNKAPIITCPADFTGCPGTTLEPSITGSATASPATANCKTPKLRFSDTYLSLSDCETLIQRTWKATDPDNSNLFSTCIQIIKLEDKTPPVITFCPPNVTVQSGNDCTAIVNWNPPVATDNCAHVNITTSILSGSVFQLGQTTVVITAIDNCGNSSSCTFNITVIENCCQHPPVLNCPSDFTGCPSASIEPATTGTATALPGDVHCAQPLVSFKDTTIKYINCSLEILRTWTATDPQHSIVTSSCIQKIILKDDVPPIFTFCPPNVTVQSNDDCVAEVNWNEPTATDNCGTAVVTTSLPSGFRFQIGVTGVVVIATDACGNTSKCEFIITVQENCCNNPPTILCPGDYRACPGSSIDTSITGKAIADPFHPVCQQPTISFTDNIVSTEVCRTIIHRVWKGVNPKNNAQTICTQIIILEDVEIPIFVSCPHDVTIDPQYNCNTTVNWILPLANDNCGIKSMLSTHNSGDTFTKGITRVVYTATDNCGNTASCWFFITVTDKCCDKNPLIHCPPDYTSCPGPGIDPSVTGKATAEPGKVDCLNPLISFTDRVISTGTCSGVIKLERTWIAVDPNINSLRSECKQIIDIKDIEPPRIQNMPADLTVNAKGSCDVPVFWIHPVAVDNCGLSGLSFNYRPGTRFKDGTTTVIYTAVDLCGLVTKDSFDITVRGTEIGVICPDDTTVIRTDPFLNGAFVDWSTPKAKHCKPCKDNIPGFIYMGELDGHRYFCSTGPAYWSTAKNISEQLGGRMAIINSEKENKFLASKLNGQTAWLGATDEVREGRFVWLDDTPLSFTSWLPGQPNDANGDEDYIELLPDGSWNDQNGSVNREYIIEIPCYELTQIGGAKQGEMLPCGINKITYAVNKDGKSDTCSFNITVDCEKESVYCKAKALNSTYMYINRVEFAGIDTITGDNGGYKFFNHACGSITAGQTYPICVSPGFLTSTYKVYWKIWIDFNADGFFDPVTEEVVYGFGTTTMCATLKMPPSLPKKQTRMRVIMSYSGYPASPCSSPLYGEVEDYCILMNGASAVVPENDPTPFAFNPVQLHCAANYEENEKQILDNGNSNELNIREQDHAAFDVDLFPNPSSNKVFAISKHDNLTDYEIYNTHGKMILKSVDQKAGNEFNFSVGDWPNGIYTIIIFNNAGEQLIKRFMVNH